MSDEPDDYVIVKFRMLNHNWERLYSAAAFNGEDMETSLNRATALYELVNRAAPEDVIAWQDREGVKRSLVVLPLSIQVFRWLPWLKLEISSESKRS